MGWECPDIKSSQSGRSDAYAAQRSVDVIQNQVNVLREHFTLKVKQAEN